LDDPPELVTFAKKMQLGGYYHTNECKPKQAYRIFNTWMGDPARLAMAEVVVKEIKENNLVKNAKDVGDVLLGGLKDLQVRIVLYFYKSSSLYLCRTSILNSC